MSKVAISIKTFIIPTLLLLCHSALAGPYVGGQVGLGSLRLENGTPANGTTFYSATDRTGTAGRLNLGWQFNQYVSAEFGIMKYTKAAWRTSDNATAKINTHTLDLLLRGNVELDYNLSLGGLIGPAFIHQNNDLSNANNNGATVILDNHTSVFVPKIGVVGAYKFNDNIDIHLTYTRTFGKGARNDNSVGSSYVPPADFFGAGINMYIFK